MGRGIFQDIGNKLREAHDYLKSNRVISQGLQKVAKSGVLGSYSGISRAAGNLAGALGYGRRRKRYGRRRVMGRGISSQVSSSVRRIIF
jgi:TctA family transporter